MSLTPSRFAEFFRAVHGFDPFPWQQMLAERVVEEGWPDVLDLPTGAGKTACLDIGIFALACQADRPAAERTATRRIFFVVDRRIVVDAAYARARKLAIRLRDAKDGCLAEVANRLRFLQGGGSHEDTLPLMPARIRGGIARDDGWIRSPSQPAIISGTVDQVGSRLLFRAYGPGLNTASIHAALVGNDSLILLDEAHCAVPFFQTASGVARYRDPAWAEEPLPSPFKVVVMSATPPESACTVWPSPAERTSALDHPKLQQRLGVGKIAELTVARRPKAPRKGEAGLRTEWEGDDELVLDAADRAVKLAATGRKRIAIMVNRVKTARAIHAGLMAETAGEKDPLDADLVLLTGRMRPLDRDAVIGRWNTTLEASEKQPQLARPVIVVTTQCLEVGADYSFDALITECASLDALRQRFGRLDRLGTVGDAPGVILIRKSQIRDDDRLDKLDQEGKLEDPIYGNALARTWNWLGTVAQETDGRKTVDFGVDAMEQLLPATPDERAALLGCLKAPAPDAPVLLPAHLDCWVQTAPSPAADPDPAIFLHGPGRGEPEVSVVLRADLIGASRNWPEIVAFCPPLSVEAVSVPLRVLRAWMRGAGGSEDPGGDVESAEQTEDETTGRGQREVLLWKGRDKSKVESNPGAIRPHQVVVIPVTKSAGILGDFTGNHPDGAIEDLADQAAFVAGRRPRIRLHPAVLAPWKGLDAVSNLLAWQSSGDVDDLDDEANEELSALLGALAEPVDVEPNGLRAPGWLIEAAGHLKEKSRRRPPAKHPGGGWVIESQGRALTRTGDIPVSPEEPVDADDADRTSLSGGAVSLGRHLQDVAGEVASLARRCLPEEIARVVERAALWHDLGKADWRFQVMLHGGNEISAAQAEAPLAKSSNLPRSRLAAARARELSGLPQGWRHEMLSFQIAEQATQAEAEERGRDLLLHLIASHHGHARPFAPVVPDTEPGAVDLAGVAGVPEGLSAEVRRSLVPPHRVDSGVPDRFWRLVRRYGWWGLALIEAVLRVSDWVASDREESVPSTGGQKQKGAA